jgi:hypothetical protein
MNKLYFRFNFELSRKNVKFKKSVERKVYVDYAMEYLQFYRFVTIVYKYQHYGHYTSSCILFKTQLNSTQHKSMGFSVPHRKYIMPPLRVQQVNAINRFVSMAY